MSVLSVQLHTHTDTQMRISFRWTFSPVQQSLCYCWSSYLHYSVCCSDTAWCLSPMLLMGPLITMQHSHTSSAGLHTWLLCFVAQNDKTICLFFSFLSSYICGSKGDTVQRSVERMQMQYFAFWPHGLVDNWLHLEHNCPQTCQCNSGGFLWDSSRCRRNVTLFPTFSTMHGHNALRQSAFSLISAGFHISFEMALICHQL